MSTPKIRLRGIRSRVPKGYILGRSSSGKGEVELLDLRSLRQIGVASSGSVARNKSPIGFGFYAEGLLANHELLGSAVFGIDVTFTDDATGTAVTCIIPPTADATLTLVDNTLTQVGTIVFLAGATTATVAWAGGTYTLVAGTPLRLYAPTPADTTLADISGTVTGAR